MLGNAVRLVATGIVIGLGASLALTRVLESQLYEVSATDPAVLEDLGDPVSDAYFNEGTDPLAGFGPHAVDDVRRHDTLANVGDLVINSPIDPGTEEVAAYEELVGCHGGLGGWQTEAVLVHPAGWPHDEEPLIGADAVHRQLVRWLEALGQRRGLAVTPAPQPAPEQQPAGPASGATPDEVPSPGTG